MSIEKVISDLTFAVQQLTQALNKETGATTVPQAPAPVAPVVQAPVVQMPAPPVFTPPVFAPPVQAPTSLVAPFHDTQGLIAYTMAAYKEMGPAKGAQIQAILTQLGCANINELKPESYGAFHLGIENLKRG